MLRELAREVREAWPRVEARGDDEAVHDLRVGLRRLRSLLRLARDLYEPHGWEKARGALKSVSDATGTLRDEEVLHQTLAKLTVPAGVRAPLDAWIAKRKTRERSLRRELVRLLRAGVLEDALAVVLAVIEQPEDDPPLRKFARDAVLDAQLEVEELATTAPEDIESLHELRILYKRLRYAIEGLEGALAPEITAMRAVAERFQKRLGDIHDFDVAAQTITAAKTLAPEQRALVLAAIAEARQRAVTRYFDEARRPSPSTEAEKKAK